MTPATRVPTRSTRLVEKAMVRAGIVAELDEMFCRGWCLLV